MKTTLLFGFLLITFYGNAQSPINSFYIDDNASFAVVTSSVPLNQSAAGANQVWNFDQLVEIGNSSYTNSTPTPAQITTFPNTNAVILESNTSNGVPNTSQFFTKNVASVVSITGLISTGLQLNFSTNNATLGAFPMNYGFSNTDPVAGNYVYGTYSGTFTGTMVTSVDAYGSLYRNIGGIPNSTATRLKTVITLSLNYGFLSNIGTITQTTYSYYKNPPVSADGLLFRTSTTVSIVGIAGINQTDTLMESYLATALATTSVSLSENQLQIVQNPVKNTLELKVSDAVVIQTINIVDANGTIVCTQGTSEKTMDVSSLPNGIYFVKIATNKGSTTKKIIKE